MSNCCFVWRSKQNNHARDHNKTKTLGLILLHNLHTHTLFPLFTCLLHFSSFDALLLYDSLLSLLRDFFPLAPQFAELLKFTIILLDFPLSSFISLSLKSTPRRATQHTHTPTQTIRTQSAVIFPPAIIYRFARALFFVLSAFALFFPAKTMDFRSLYTTFGLLFFSSFHARTLHAHA